MIFKLEIDSIEILYEISNELTKLSKFFLAN